LASKIKKETTSHAKGYNLTYFTLWWNRMAVEGRKDAKEKRRKEEERRLG
jgi:hypothetical protein